MCETPCLSSLTNVIISVSYFSFQFTDDMYTYSATAELVTTRYDKSLDICAEVQNILNSDSIVYFNYYYQQLITTKELTAGSHVLTIVPKGNSNIIIAWLVTA